MPVLPRHARRGAPDPRAREHAAPGADRPARRRTRWRPTRWPRRCRSACPARRCRRECPTGVDMAKMKIEAQHARARTHGVSRQGPADRAACRAGRRSASRLPGLANAREWRAGRAGARREGARLRARARPAPLRAATRSGTTSGGAAPARARRRRCCWPTPSTATSSRRTCAPPCACCARPATVPVGAATRRAAALLRPHLPRGRHGGRGAGGGAADDGRAGRPTRRWWGWSRPACSRCGTSSRPCCRARRARRLADRAMLLSEFLVREKADCRSSALAPAGACPRPLPPEVLRRLPAMR